MPKYNFEQVQVATTEHGFAIMLDAQPLTTPNKNPIHLPTQKMAERLAQEWETSKQDARAQNTAEHDALGAIDLQSPPVPSLPMTRIVSGAFDLSDSERSQQAERFVAYGNHDLLCYRATHPDMLVMRQNMEWDPLIDWCAQTFALSFEQTTKLQPIDQPPATLEKLHALYMHKPHISVDAQGVYTSKQDTEEAAPALEAIANNLWQNGLGRFATLSNSAILALAVAAGRLDTETAYQVSFLDEFFQMEQWGVNDESLQRLARLKQEMALLVDYFSLLD